MGFPEALKVSQSLNKKLTFGIRFNICPDTKQLEEKKKTRMLSQAHCFI